MGLPVKGAPLPQQTAKRWYMVRSPKGAEARRVVCLDDVWEGFWTHWQGRVFPCTNTSDCEQCSGGINQRWSGYFAAWDLGRHDRCIEAVTEGQAKALRAILQERGSLRGCAFEFRRSHATKPNSPVVVKYLGQGNPQEQFEAHPIIDSLNRLWGINDNFRRNQSGVTTGTGENNRGRGVPLPQRPDDLDNQPSGKEPTPEQWDRLRQSLNGFGKMEM